MRLASKMFAASTLVILALVGVAAWSLLAVDHLVRAHRDITGQSLPALQVEVSLQEAVPRLLRIEARYLVLRDRAYGDLLKERAERAAADLEGLDPLLRSTAEQKSYREAVVALATYQQHVNRERALLNRGNTAQALRVSEGPARAAAERLDRALTQLTEATSAEVTRAQAVVRALERRTWTTVLVTLAVSLVAAVGATGVVVFRLTRSVRRLSAATRQVADGSFQELTVETGDEIGQLTHAFNRMAEQLREVETLKQQFFSQISHEIRNPLTAIRAATQLLMKRGQQTLDAKERHVARRIATGERGLLGGAAGQHHRDLALVGERLVGGDDKAFAPALALRNASNTSRGPPYEKNRRFPSAAETAHRMSRSVFTPAGGSVRVAMTDAATHLELVVRDNGPGIPTAALPKIFEPYQQAHRGRKGSGLGLAIVKGLVEAHDGSIVVDSDEGKGTCFTVRLPRAEPPS